VRLGVEGPARERLLGEGLRVAGHAIGGLQIAGRERSAGDPRERFERVGARIRPGERPPREPLRARQVVGRDRGANLGDDVGLRPAGRRTGPTTSTTSSPSAPMPTRIRGSSGSTPTPAHARPSSTPASTCVAGVPQRTSSPSRSRAKVSTRTPAPRPSTSPLTPRAASSASP
jgi:hypothetical protein